MIVTCYSCGHANEFHAPVGRRDACAECGTDLRCCMQCRFFDSSTTTECREPQAEVPRDRDRGNFCDFFQPGSARAEEAGAADQAKAAFEALFKK
jgi:hypothetical protein